MSAGLAVAAFTFLHLFNHVVSVAGIDKHLSMMAALRFVYRNKWFESVLMAAIAILIISGLRLFWIKRKTASSFFERLHIWTGIYLGVFLIFHLTAVFAGRHILYLDTNFYFGVAGLNTFPLNLFFIPYYGLAVISFFGHIGSVHNKKMKHTIAGLTPEVQSKGIFVFGICLTVILFFGLTNSFKGVTIPEEYNILIGK